MSEILFRAVDVDVTGDGRTVEGRAYRFDHPSMVSDDGGLTRYPESFLRGAATRSITQRPIRPVFVEHAYADGSVADVRFSNGRDGLYFRARLHDGELAELARARLSAGELPEVSVGFRAIASRKRGQVTERVEVAINELSLTRMAQHDGAEVLAVRAEIGTPRLDDLRRRRRLLLPQ